MTIMAALLLSNLAAIELSAASVEQQPQADQWYDNIHAKVSSSATNSAHWLDSFFGDPQLDDPAKNFVRLRLQQELSERSSDQLSYRISAAMYLPQTENKLKLLVESDDNSELVDADNTHADGDHEKVDLDVALRWKLLQPNRWDFDFDLGVRFNSGLDPFIRSRAHYQYSVTTFWNLHFSQEFKIQRQESWSETSRLLIAEQGRQGFGWRWNSRAKYGEQTEGAEWNSSLIYTTRISSKSALASFIKVSGATRDTEIQSEISLIGLAYRRNFFRSWLFFEIEPHLTWPRKYEYKRNWFFLGTFEIQFGHR